MTTTTLRVARDPAPLAARLVLATYASVLSQGLLVIGSLNELQVLGALDPAEALTAGTRLPATPIQDLMIVGGGLLATLASLVSGVLLLVWTYRVNLNALVLSPQKQISPAWAVGWWFVPIGSYWMPFKAMSETWRISAAPGDHAAEGEPRLLMGWWAATIAATVVGLGASYWAMSATNAGQMILSDRLSILGSVLSVPASLLLIKVIRAVTAMQVARLGPAYGQRERPAAISG